MKLTQPFWLREHSLAWRVGEAEGMDVSPQPSPSLEKI